MKKYVVLLIAFLSIGFWSCKDDPDPEPEVVVPTIMLSAPTTNASMDLSAETNAEVTFSWILTNGTVNSSEVEGGYTLYLSKTEDLSSPKTYASSTLSLKISSGNLDALLGEWGVDYSAEATIYWTVKPTVEGQAVSPATARALKLKRLPEPAPEIALSEPAADAQIDLKSVANVNFSWTVTGTITGGYTLYLGMTEDMASPVTYTSDVLSKTVTAEDLDTKLEEWGIAHEAEATVYWTVKPTATQTAVTPDARVLKLKRLPRESSVLGNMRGVVASAGYNRVRLVWEQNPDPLIETTVIYWNDRADSIEHTFTRTTDGWQHDTAYISGLTEGTAYTFELINKNQYDDRSAASVASGQVTPYGDAWKATIDETQTRLLSKIAMVGYNPASPNTTIGNVILTWDAAPVGSVATKIRYKKSGGSKFSAVYAKDAASGVTTNLTQVGNRLLHSDDILYISSLYVPEDGGIDTLSSPELQSQMVVYIATGRRLDWGYTFATEVGKWTVGAAYTLTNEKLIWGINQAEKITILDCNRFGNYGIYGGAAFNQEYPSIYRFKWIVNDDNTVTIDETDSYSKLSGQEYDIVNNDEPKTKTIDGQALTVSSETHENPSIPAGSEIIESISTFNPTTRVLSMNYQRIIWGNPGSRGGRTFVIETLTPKQ